MSCWQSPPFSVVRTIKTTRRILFLGIEEHQPALVQQYMHGPKQSSMQDSWTGTGSVLRPHHAPKGGVWYRLEHPANPSISASCVYTPALDASDLVTQLASIFKGCCRQTFWYLGALVTCTVLQMAVKQQKKSASISSNAWGQSLSVSRSRGCYACRSSATQAETLEKLWSLLGLQELECIK